MNKTTNKYNVVIISDRMVQMLLTPSLICQKDTAREGHPQSLYRKKKDKPKRREMCRCELARICDYQCKQTQCDGDCYIELQFFSQLLMWCVDCRALLGAEWETTNLRRSIQLDYWKHKSWYFLPPPVDIKIRHWMYWGEEGNIFHNIFNWSVSQWRD